MNKVEKSLVQWVAKVTPWVAPVPSAWFVGSSAIEHLDVPLPVGVVIAIVIETLGLSTVHTALWAYQWNADKRKSDPGAPVSLAVALGAVYLVATLLLVVFLEVWPAAAVYAPAIFPILSVVGAVNLALISNQERRETEVAQQKATSKKERDERNATKRDTDAAVAAMPRQSSITIADWRDYVRHCCDNGGQPTREAAIAAMVRRGLPQGKNARDKVNRWYRDTDWNNGGSHV